MGRRKIDMVRIDNERHRTVTYAKRKTGLIKKATELAILCDATVGIIIFGANKKMTVYSSSTIDEVINRFRENSDTPEVRSFQDWPAFGCLSPAPSRIAAAPCAALRSARC